MSLQERVEQIFSLQKDRYPDLRPATGSLGHYNGYQVEPLRHEVVRVRCTWALTHLVVSAEEMRWGPPELKDRGVSIGLARPVGKGGALVLCCAAHGPRHPAGSR
jgi:hypothetical protein